MHCPVCDYPKLCGDCVGTTHDPDVVTGRANLERILRSDGEFAVANDLREGDFVHDDGTITRREDQQ